MAADSDLPFWTSTEFFVVVGVIVICIIIAIIIICCVRRLVIFNCYDKFMYTAIAHVILLPLLVLYCSGEVLENGQKPGCKDTKR